MASNDVNRHKENFQFLGNSYKERNTPRKTNKAPLEISSSEVSPSPIKLKSLSPANKEQVSSFLNDQNQIISPSLTAKNQVPNFLNIQNALISPSHSHAKQIPGLLTDQIKEKEASFLSNQNRINSPSYLNHNQELAIDQMKNVTPSSLTSPKDSQSESYEAKYKKARQKIKGMKIIIDVLNARVQKTVANRQELEKQIAELKQQLYEGHQSQMPSNNNSVIKSIAVSPEAISPNPNTMPPQSSLSIKVEDQDRINNVFDKISRFEKTCDSAIQAFNEFQSLISSPASVQNQIQEPNTSNRDIDLSKETPKLPIPKRISFSNASTPVSPQVNQNIEMLKKKNKQLQAKIDESNDTITQLNAKIRRRENENSMLKQQIADLENSFNFDKKNNELKLKKAHEYLHDLQQRFSQMQKEGNITNQNQDIIQILKENEALAKRVKELSMKNSELVRIIYNMQKESPTENKSSSKPQAKNDLALSPKLPSSPANPMDSAKSEPDKLSIPMSVKYSFNQETEEKSQDDSGVSCFVE